jgi:hypothetical protein
MEWVKLAAVPAYYIDGSILRAGEPAEVLFCRGLAHCGNVESGGLIDKTVVPMLVSNRSASRADALVREGLWIDEGTHYRVRSWDKWQDAHDVAAEKRAKDRERKRKSRRNLGESADVSDGRHADTSQRQSRDSHGDKRDGHTVEGEGEGEGDPVTTSLVAADAAVTPRSTRGTRVPDVFPPDEATATRLADWARERTPAVQLKQETETWQDWHRAKGDTAKDWAASWRTWMRRAQKDAEKTGPVGIVRYRGNARVAEGDAILAEAFARGTQQHPELGA